MKVFLKFFGVFSLVTLASFFLLYSAHAQSTGQIMLIPNTQSVVSGQQMIVEVMVNSGNELVNAAQVNISYPQTKLTVRKVDTTSSVFDVAAENKTEDGVLKIARGVVMPVRDIQKVATVTFAARGNVMASELQIQPDSAIMRSRDNKNMYVVPIVAEPSVVTPETKVLPVEGEHKDFLEKLIDFNDSLWEALIEKLLR